MINTMSYRIAIIGLGYVGLPVALEFAQIYPSTVGFDIDQKRISRLKLGIDDTAEVSTEELVQSSILLTDQAEDLAGVNFYIITVPTPVDGNNNPDFTALESASNIVGKHLKPGDIVVYESTVYPGVTESICGPFLEKESGLQSGIDFKLGYSPERINPGDSEHSLKNITKVVAGQDQETAKMITEVYGSIVDAGIHIAPSIQVAETAKVLENTQRDLNIALMNELAIICDKLGFSSRDVLDAASTKWNFLNFVPGLVGGHCIGVDPYYLTTRAEQLGYHPQVILAGRRINDNMPNFVANKLVKLMVENGMYVRDARVGIIGLTFKENVPDIRNSGVLKIINELKQFSMNVSIADPLASKEEVRAECGLELTDPKDWSDLDAIIYAVPHLEYDSLPCNFFLDRLKKGGVLVDIKAKLDRGALDGMTYWCL